MQGLPGGWGNQDVGAAQEVHVPEGPGPKQLHYDRIPGMTPPHCEEILTTLGADLPERKDDHVLTPGNPLVVVHLLAIMTGALDDLEARRLEEVDDRST